jgi:hypothetical protein
MSLCVYYVIPKRVAGGRQPNGSQSVGTHTEDSRTPQKTFVLSDEEHGLLWGGILTSRFSLHERTAQTVSATRALVSRLSLFGVLGRPELKCKFEVGSAAVSRYVVEDVPGTVRLNYWITVR